MTAAVAVDIEELFARHRRAVLGFSGGRDSLVLLDMLRPYHDRVTLLWVNSGFMFPHMVEFVRAFGTDWRLVELAGDLAAQFRQFGLPSTIVPVRHAVGGHPHPLEPKLTPWIHCCARVRFQPALDWLRDQGVTLFLHGQRREDGNPMPWIGDKLVPGVEAHAPLWYWSNADVATYIEAHGITLPSHYGEVQDSLECFVCTAPLTSSRLAYMQRAYPEYARRVEDAARQIRVAVLAAADLEFGCLDRG